MLPVNYKRPTVSLFSDFFDEDYSPTILNNFFQFPTFNTTSIMRPIQDIIENDKEYVVELQLAGIKKEDISVDVEKNILTIKAERKKIEDLKYNRKESYAGKYMKSFTLPDSVDEENIGASLNDGVLIVTIPKLEDAKLGKRKIEIK